MTEGKTPIVRVDAATGEVIEDGGALARRPDPPEQTALSRRGESDAPLARGANMALMALEMTEEEFEYRVMQLKRGMERVHRIKRELMVPGVHYDVVPGVKKASIGKAGCEVLTTIFDLAVSYDHVDRRAGDGKTGPLIHYIVYSSAHLGTLDGPVIAQGVGSANSWETKYRYRDDSRKCPKCGVSGALIVKKDFGRGKFVPGWVCWNNPARGKNGCGAEFSENDPAITEQQVGRTEHPDPFDLDNTLLKMAKKRSYDDCVITGTKSSDTFTQDMGEDDDKKRSRPITKEERARLFAVAEECKVSKDDLKGLMVEMTGKESTNTLTATEALALIEEMESRSQTPEPAGTGEDTGVGVSVAPEAPEKPSVPVSKESGKADSMFDALDKADPPKPAKKGTYAEQYEQGTPDFIGEGRDGKCGRTGCSKNLSEIVGGNGIGYRVCPVIVRSVTWVGDSPVLKDRDLCGHTLEAV